MIGIHPTAPTWSATSGATPLATATATVVKAAIADPVSIYLTDLQIVNVHATVSTVITILDDTTVVWTGYLPAMTVALVAVPVNAQLSAPIKITAGKALNIKAVTTGATIYWNAQGFIA
jgi:hypothetical protein